MSAKKDIPPLIDLSGWNRLPERHEPLAGQQNLFDLDTLIPLTQQSHTGLAALGIQQELFESGRDLPGAAEREQRIIWDL